MYILWIPSTIPGVSFVEVSSSDWGTCWYSLREADRVVECRISSSGSNSSSSSFSDIYSPIIVNGTHWVMPQDTPFNEMIRIAEFDSWAAIVENMRMAKKACENAHIVLYVNNFRREALIGSCEGCDRMALNREGTTKPVTIETPANRSNDSDPVLGEPFSWVKEVTQAVLDVSVE